MTATLWTAAILLALGVAWCFVWLAELTERDWREIPPPVGTLDLTGRPRPRPETARHSTQPTGTKEPAPRTEIAAHIGNVTDVTPCHTCGGNLAAFIRPHDPSCPDCHGGVRR